MKTKLLIFGITGDLGVRKLLPALEQIINNTGFDDLSVIGASRREVDRAELFVNCQNKDFLDGKLSVFKMDLANLDDYIKLRQFVNLGDDEQMVIYLAVPPQATSQIVDFLGEAGINAPNVKILFEKPFGVDLASAQQLISQSERYFKEEQIYRIDHYLAKEMAQNIVAFRGRNALFSGIWSNNFIESIDVVALETLDIEGRAQFYEHTGALRDFVQGHLMQLAILALMDIPHDFEWNEMPDLRLAALKQIESVSARGVIRAQYEGYRDEVGNPNSKVETFVSLKLVSSQPKWLGVPITLTTGKALSESKTEIRVKLKKTNGAESNNLIFKIQPNEGIDIELFAKKPGYGKSFESNKLSFNYPVGTDLPDAYEQVIVDAILSQKSLFTRNEEVIQSWRILQPVLDDWASDQSEIKIYPKGSSAESVLA